MLASNRRGLYLILMTILVILSFGMVTTIGVADISFVDTYRIIGSRLPFIKQYITPDWSSGHENIVLYLRLPRALLSLMVGSALSLAGVTYQGLLRNPLADPFTIGVSSGAAVGASLFMLIRTGIIPAVGHLGVIPETFGLPGFSFIFGMLSLWIVYSLASVEGRVPPVTLLLAGVVVSSFLSALISFMMMVAGESMQGLFFWISGGFNLASWQHVWILAPYVILSGIVIFYFARDLNIILLGEESATYLGVSVETVKKILLVTASLLTAASVSVSGMIGFVGLIVPHAARLMIGPDHKYLVPGAFMMGAVALPWMDVMARMLLGGAEIPVGIVTAFVGAPFFLLLLKQRRQDYFF